MENSKKYSLILDWWIQTLGPEPLYPRRCCMKRLWFLLVVLGSTLVAGAADWPQWRGPQRDGYSQEKGLLKEWPGEGPKLLWQLKDIGEGYGTPAVAGTRLYLLSNRGMDS